MAINMGTAVAYLELDTSKFRKGFKSAFNDLKVFGDKSATAEQKMKGLQSAFNKTGSLLTKSVTLPLLGVGTASTKVAMDFEAGMSEVLAISGATTEEFELLEKKAIEMGAKTKFSAGESADAFKYMAMAGWDTEEMLNSIAGVMDLAAASGEDLALTSDIVTDAMTAFGLSAGGTSKVIKDGLIVEVSNATRFVDVLAKASSKSNTNVAMMGETFKYVAPVAGALGYSVEDTAVAIGLMANSGIKASQAGTALRTLMTNMAKPTEQMSVAMDVLGLSLDDGEGNMLSFKEVMLQMREGFGQLIISEEEFEESLNRISASFEDGSMSEKQYEKALGRLIDRAYGAEGALKAKYASMLAGKEGMSGLLAIVNATDEEFESLTNEINNASGATQQMASIMLDNTAGAMEQLTGALESAGIIIGKQLTPYIRKLAEWITGLVEKFNSLSEEQQEQITKWGLIIASIGPLLLIGSKLIGVVLGIVNAFKMIKNAITVLKTFGTALMSMNPVVLGVVAVITALVGVFIYLWNNCEGFRDFWIELWNNLKQKVSEIVETLINFFTVTIPEAFNNFVNVIVPNFINSIVSFFSNLPYNIGVIVGKLLGHIVLFGEDIKKWAETEVPKFIDSVVNFFSELPSRIYNWLVETINKIYTWGSKLVSEGKRIASEFVEKVINYVKELPSKFKKWIDELPEKVKSIGEQLKEAGKEILDKLWDGIKSVGKKITKWFEGFAQNIASFISGIVDGFNSVVSSANSAKTASKSVNGSHANGLDYVPFDGYVAELHKGERVLTKQENEEYNKGRTNNNGGDTFVFYNTKPDPYTYAKQMKRTKQELLYGF